VTWGTKDDLSLITRMMLLAKGTTAKSTGRRWEELELDMRLWMEGLLTLKHRKMSGYIISSSGILPTALLPSSPNLRLPMAFHHWNTVVNTTLGAEVNGPEWP
jgi:hypothetical protein